MQKYDELEPEYKVYALLSLVVEPVTPEYMQRITGVHITIVRTALQHSGIKKMVRGWFNREVRYIAEDDFRLQVQRKVDMLSVGQHITGVISRNW